MKWVDNVEKFRQISWLLAIRQNGKEFYLAMTLMIISSRLGSCETNELYGDLRIILMTKRLS